MENIQDIALYELNKMETSYNALKEREDSKGKFLFMLYKEDFTPLRLANVRGYIINKTRSIVSLTLQESFPLFQNFVKNYFEDNTRDKVADSTMRELFLRVCSHLNGISTDIIPSGINIELSSLKA